MTARLVALMSALLFVSLLAFMLLVRQSEDAVMREVPRTVTRVGTEMYKAVLTHRFSALPGADAALAAEATELIALAPPGLFLRDLRRVYGICGDADASGDAQGDGAGTELASGVWVSPGPAADGVRTETRAITAHPGDSGTWGRVVVEPAGVDADGRHRFRIAVPGGAPDAAGIAEILWVARDGEEPPEALKQRLLFWSRVLAEEHAAPVAREFVMPRSPVRVAPVGDGTMQVDIRVIAAARGATPPDAAAAATDASHAADGDASFVLAAMPDAADTAQGVAEGPALWSMPFDALVEGDPAGGQESRMAFRMSTRDYGAVFEALRSRMWALFLGVALVGTLLSAGLARRFTRPVRELDRAIRRLAREDLDVHVPVQGSGEVARLTHAFNDMARRLRIARVRSRDVTRRERLAALGRLAAGVAHDVRNPLHSINLSLQHLQDTCRPPLAAEPEFDRTVGLIRGEIRRLDGLVSNFLRFARGGAGARRPLAVEHRLRETVEVVGKEARARNVSISVHTEGGEARVLGDAEALRSALLNLVLNAFEAMPRGGELVLRARTSDERVILEVADTGVGIAPEDREQIFDFGYTPREDGHGLGLAMVHEVVVEEHAGRIEVESQQGAGTTIRIELPVLAHAALEAAH